MDVGGLLPFWNHLLGVGLVLFAALPAVAEPPVRVRLQASSSRLLLQGFAFKVQGQGETDQLKPQRQQSLEIERSNEGAGFSWKLTRRAPGQEPVIQVIKGTRLLVEGRHLRHGVRDLPEKLVLAGRSRTFDVVGVLPMNQYLMGVLSSEMPLTWPLEALKSQAIAARSYTLAVMNERKTRHFDVESSVMDQVFQHVSAKRGQESLIQKAKRAVEETSEIVLLDQRGRVSKAYYHADCGGRPSSASQVWGRGSSGRQVVIADSFCSGSPNSKWTLKLSGQELGRRLQKSFGIRQALDSLVAVASLPGSRAEQVKLQFENGSEKLVSADGFRAALGYSDLKSTLFEVTKKGAAFEFKGQGWGHGVGLCQWGTRKRAESGETAFSILKHYYPENQLLVRAQN